MQSQEILRHLLSPEEQEQADEEAVRAQRFGEWLKTRAWHLNINEFVKSIHKDRAWWGQIERGERLPTQEEIEQIASAAGVRALEALEAAGYTDNTKPDEELAKMLTFCTERLPIENRSEFRGYLHEMAIRGLDRMSRGASPFPEIG